MRLEEWKEGDRSILAFKHTQHNIKLIWNLKNSERVERGRIYDIPRISQTGYCTLTAFGVIFKHKYNLGWQRKPSCDYNQVISLLKSLNCLVTNSVLLQLPVSVLSTGILDSTVSRPVQSENQTSGSYFTYVSEVVPGGQCLCSSLMKLFSSPPMTTEDSEQPIIKPFDWSICLYICDLCVPVAVSTLDRVLSQVLCLSYCQLSDKSWTTSSSFNLPPSISTSLRLFSVSIHSSVWNKSFLVDIPQISTFNPLTDWILVWALNQQFMTWPISWVFTHQEIWKV